MKRSFKYRCCVLAIMFFCVFLTSCSLNDDSKKTNVVIIAGIHSNSEIMNMCSEKQIKKIFSDLGEIRVIVADGKPKPAVGTNEKYIGQYNEEYITESEETKRNNRHIWERNYLPEQIQSFIEEFKKLEPDDSEVNTLGAILEAVNILNGFSQEEEEEVNKEIIIYDTGLCTNGGFSFMDSEWADMLFCDKELKDEKIQTMVESLKSKKLMPILSDIQVTWYGIGKTAEPQTELEPNHLDNLKRIWWNILKAAGAIPPSGKGEYDYFFQIESQGKTNYSQEVTPIKQHKKKDNEDHPISEIKPTTIPVKKLGFKRESSEFSSEEKAMEVLKPYAKNILLYPNENILLIGTTADPKRNGGSLILSEKRAARVKEYLVKLGVPDNRMKIFGWGAESSLYDSSEWVGNSFKENIAEKNRAVHLVPEKSEYAQELLRQEHP